MQALRPDNHRRARSPTARDAGPADGPRQTAWGGGSGGQTAAILLRRLCRPIRQCRADESRREPAQFPAGKDRRHRNLSPPAHPLLAAGLTTTRDRLADGSGPGPGKYFSRHRPGRDLREARQILCARGLEATSPYRARKIERVLDQLQPDVVFFPQQSIFPKNVAAPCALVVHDLYHLFLPQYLSPGQRFFRRRSYGYAMSRAERIVAISHFTQKCIMQHYAVAAERVAVIPHGWEAAPAPVEADAGFGGKYLYYPAITRPHKNHHLLLESIAALRARLFRLSTYSFRNPNGLLEDSLPADPPAGPGQRGPARRLCALRPRAATLSRRRMRRIPLVVRGLRTADSRGRRGRQENPRVAAGGVRRTGGPRPFSDRFFRSRAIRAGVAGAGRHRAQNRPWTWDETAAATMAVLASAAGREVAAPQQLVWAA